MKHGRQGFITIFIRRALEGEEIVVFGDGRQLRDFTYVDDAVEAFLAAAASDEANGQALNVGGIEPVSLLRGRRALPAHRRRGRRRSRRVPWPEERQKIDIGSIYVDRSRLERGLTAGRRP